MCGYLAVLYLIFYSLSVNVFVYTLFKTIQNDLIKLPPAQKGIIFHLTVFETLLTAYPKNLHVCTFLLFVDVKYHFRVALQIVVFATFAFDQ